MNLGNGLKLEKEEGFFYLYFGSGDKQVGIRLDSLGPQVVQNGVIAWAKETYVEPVVETPVVPDPVVLVVTETPVEE